MINTADFLNKNLFRKFPIQQGATCLTDNGTLLPSNLISSISLTIPQVNGAGGYQPYISQININKTNISITINCLIVGVETINLGTFNGVISSDFQVLSIPSGFIRLGKKTDLIAAAGLFQFSTPTQTGLEVSTFIIIPVPGVSQFNYREQTLTGAVQIGKLNNLNLTESTNTFSLSVNSSAGLSSLVDKNSQFLNCPTPVILNINGATPYPDSSFSDSNNIYVLGIEPVQIAVDSTSASLIPATPSITLNEFCTLNNQSLPPTNPQYLVTNPSLGFVGTNSYYSKSQTPVVNFMNESVPEFVYWYSTTYTLNISSPTVTTYYFVNPAGITGTLNQIYLTATGGSITGTVKISGTNVASLVNLTASSNGLVVLSTGSNTFGVTDTISFTVTATTATAFEAVLFYTQTFS